VQEDDVAAVDPPVDRVHVGVEDGLVVRGLAAPEVAAIADGPVEAVVQALGDGEELGVGVDHHPPRVGADVPGVAAEEREDLGQPATVRSGADVPHSCPVERLRRRRGRLL
jgi:hypothetical protein